MCVPARLVGIQDCVNEFYEFSSRDVTVLTVLTFTVDITEQMNGRRSDTERVNLPIWQAFTIQKNMNKKYHKYPNK